MYYQRLVTILSILSFSLSKSLHPRDFTLHSFELLLILILSAFSSIVQQKEIDASNIRGIKEI